MKCSLCQFQYGYDGNFYQIIEDGIVRFVNLDGSPLELIPPYGYDVIEDDAIITPPTWPPII